MPDETGFKSCYRHPRRPAIRNCQYCERPICAECELESGDHRVCGPCKKKLVSATAAGVQPQAAPLGLGEVTVLRDGTVVDSENPPAGTVEPAAPGEGQAPGESPAEPAEREGEAEEAAGPEARPKAREVEAPGGPLRQLAYAAPFSVAVDLAVAGAWLLVAVLTEQWTQISILTLGLAVPWVFYNATTRKKRDGEPVWTEPPVVLVSISSFTLVTLTASLLEYLVYQTVFSSFMKFDAFVKEYFDGLGWALIAIGLACALFTPFILRIGGRRELPRLRFRRRRKPPGM